MKAGDLKSIASYFSHVPKIVLGVHVATQIPQSVLYDTPPKTPIARAVFKQTGITPPVLNMTPSHQVTTKPGNLRSIVCYFFHSPRIVPEVHVGLKDIEGPAIFSI